MSGIVNDTVEVDVNRLVMDSSVLLPPSQTPMSGIDLARRLPCGEAEKVRKAVQDFWLLRRLRTSLLQLPDDEEPLLEPPVPILPHDVLDLRTHIGACLLPSGAPPQG